MKTEHEIFSQFIDHIKSCQDLAIELSSCRPDQPWQIVATKLEEFKQGLYQMVGDGQVKGQPKPRIIQ
jgi:hypothetical protein